MQQASIYTGLVFFGLLHSLLEMVLSVIFYGISRRNEYQADRYAAETTGNPDAMIQALKILSRASLSNLTPHPAHVFLHYSHPPILERIEALRRVKPRPSGLGLRTRARSRGDGNA